MARHFPRVLGTALILSVVLGIASPAAEAQLKDRVVIISYLNIKPEAAGRWVVAFKKHLAPALDELQADGALDDWHLFVPGLHHPGNTWTHALVMVSKDRAAQAMLEQKLQEAVGGMPAGDRQLFYGSIDTNKHFDDEWREIDLEKIEVPAEEEKEEGGEEAAAQE
jgi:hypothetical protein